MLWKGGTVVLAVAAIFPLAAVQLWPTARLAELSGNRRDFEYLSGFARRRSIWSTTSRPACSTARTPGGRSSGTRFHAMPEESLTYIGLVPLFLAFMAIVRESRRDRDRPLLTILAVVTLILGFGPYAPGFRALIRLPGFSFFRAPARWSLATALALAILAGKGFDRWPEWTRPERSLRWFIGLAVFWIAAMLGLIELAVQSTVPSANVARSAGSVKPRWPGVVRWFDRAFRAMPWADDPSFLIQDPPSRK